MKNQFINPSRIVGKKPPTEQSGAARPQPEQIRPMPVDQGSESVLPQQSSAPSYAPTKQPYLQVPQSLPGIPGLPRIQKKGQLTTNSLSQAYPGQSRGLASNVPKQVDKLSPPAPPSSVNPVGNVPGPGNNGIFSPFNSYPQSNFSGAGSFQSRADHPSPGSAASYPSSGNGQYPGGKSLNNASNLPFSGGPMPSYPGNNFPGMQRSPMGPQGAKTPSQYAGPSGPRLPKLELPKLLKKNSKSYFLIWACIALGLLLIVTGGGLAYYETQIAPSLDNILGKQAIHHTGPQASNTGAAPTGRTNILLLGSDTDGKGNDPNTGVPLAQTVMIITIDPQTNYVGMLSIPRDMQVTESGHFDPKLDEVFANGYTGDTLQDKVAAGAGEMEDIIESNFGIHIDHYAWVGLNGFVKVIDTAGGIDVDTIHPMVDDSYPDDVGNPNGSIYDYERLYIAPGPQHLNGIQALSYVRTRHSDLVGDFGRTIRQQQIIDQLKTKLATPDTIAKAPELVQDLNGAVQTDMQLNDVIGLANLARGIDSNSIQRLTLGPPDYAVPSSGGRTTNYWPLCENIVPAIQKMFNIDSPNCISQFASTSSIARTTPSIVPGTFNTVLGSEPRQGATAKDAFKDNTVTNGGSASLYTGVHSLLDVLFATTFESFDAMQV